MAVALPESNGKLPCSFIFVLVLIIELRPAGTPLKGSIEQIDPSSYFP